MKIALSFQNGHSLSGHAGRCTRFLVYNIEENKILSKELVEIESEMTFHSIFHDGTYTFSENPLHDMDMIISNSMGLGFVQKMKSNGIKALQTDEQNPDLLIEKYMKGELLFTEVKNHHHH
jgi:predicted Fe-Mo cluster-binding NifX family protein